MPNTAVLRITNCIDCPHHEVQADPDPHDWFCDDDVKVECKLAKRCVTSACRPYRTRAECDVPSWCPLAATTDPTTGEAK